MIAAPPRNNAACHLGRVTIGLSHLWEDWQMRSRFLFARCNVWSTVDGVGVGGQEGFHITDDRVVKAGAV